MLRNCFLLIVALSIASLGFAEGSFEYVEIRSISQGPIVQIDTVEDFVSVAETADVSTIMVPSHESQLDSVFAFAVDGVVYQTNAYTFDTVEDYRIGSEQGFELGKDFYHASELGFSSATPYASFIENWYLSPESMENADDRGWPQETPSDLTVVFPRRVEEDTFESVLLPLLIRAQAYGHIGIYRRSRFNSNEEWKDVFVTELRSLETQEDTFEISPPEEAKGPSALRPPRDVALSMDDVPEVVARMPEYVKDQYFDRLEQRAKELDRDGLSGVVGYRWTDGHYEVRMNPIPDTWDQPPIGLLYHLAVVHGMPSYGEYTGEQSRLIEAYRLGFRGIEDMVDAETRGYSRSQRYYRGMDEGFRNSTDHSIGERLRVDGESFYATYAQTMQSVEGIRDEYDLNSYESGVILHVLEQVPRNRTLSISAVYREFQELIERKPALGNLSRDIENLGQSQLRRFLQDNQDMVQDFGTLSLENGVFTGQ